MIFRPSYEDLTQRNPCNSSIQIDRCLRKRFLRRRIPSGKQVFGAPNQGLESSLCRSVFFRGQYGRVPKLVSRALVVGGRRHAIRSVFIVIIVMIVIIVIIVMIVIIVIIVIQIWIYGQFS